MIDRIAPVTEIERKKQPNWGRLDVVVPPFSIEADPRFMYLSTETKRALSKVSYMVEAGQGASIVIGADSPVSRSVIQIEKFRS